MTILNKIQDILLILSPFALLIVYFIAYVIEKCILEIINDEENIHE